ncbi:MAG: hypothetical protein LBS40_07900 [Burkholderiales bacterium]|jgi:hypothetical protein|nr:hypothetical protein [Burkholderiales bacterium]
MTTNYSEHQYSLSIGYTNVGTIGKVEKIQFHSSLKKFRRFYNGSIHNHFMSHADADISYVLSDGWQDDGYVGYIYTKQESGTIPLYRLHKTYTPGVDVEHRYVINSSESYNLQ